MAVGAGAVKAAASPYGRGSRGLVIGILADVVGDGTEMKFSGIYSASLAAGVSSALDVVGDGTEMKVGGM